MMTEEEQIKEYLEKTKTKWKDLSESEKKVFEFIYRKLFSELQLTIGYQISPKIRELEERTETRLKNISDFDKFIENKKAVVDVWQDGCLPCNLVVPVMEKLARKNDEISFGRRKLDKEVMEKYKVSVIPTILFFDNGKIRKKIEGAVPDNIIEGEVEALKVPEDDFNKRLKTVEAIAKAKGWIVNLNPYIRNLLINGLVKTGGRCPCKVEDIPENQCPCRLVKDKYLGAEEEIRKNKRCYCGLFVSPDFKGKISEEEVLKHFK